MLKRLVMAALAIATIIPLAACPHRHPGPGPGPVANPPGPNTPLPGPW